VGMTACVGEVDGFGDDIGLGAAIATPLFH
jgi:hypothetical protein